MKSINKLILAFVVMIVILFSYAYVVGKDLQTLNGQGLDAFTTVQTVLENAGAEGDDPNALNMNTVYENHVDDFDRLYQKSDLIVEGKLKNRSQSINVVSSEVEIINIWKSDGSTHKDNIRVYEPFGYTNRNAIYIFGACLPMREGEPYLLFLKKESNGSYNLVSGLYGKYHLTQDVYYSTDTSDIDVEQIKNCDMFDFHLAEEKRQQLLKQMELGGLDKESAKQSLQSYDKLENLKQVRAQIRASFMDFKKQSK